MASKKKKQEPVQPDLEKDLFHNNFSIEFIFNQVPHFDYLLRLWLVGRSKFGKQEQTAVLTNLEFKKIEEFDPLPAQPTLTITREAATALMDSLWQVGIRPSQVGTGGQIEAMKYHLEDLRKLVFGKAKEPLGIKS